MLRENIQEENFPELPEGSRAPTYDFVYKGGFKDRNQDIQTVTIRLTISSLMICKLNRFNFTKGRYSELCTW